ncbi:hypothetical protein ACIQKE_00595 [Streptomyces griseoviridis]|uniref:hypothetical protein n=1 Tax=Streptomyces griseoviridis TaxID=45398 RepID=UPI0033C3EDF9
MDFTADTADTGDALGVDRAIGGAASPVIQTRHRTRGGSVDATAGVLRDVLHAGGLASLHMPASIVPCALFLCSWSWTIIAKDVTKQ